ncbi:MAG: hypothetical protein VW625_00065, partial [Perlucidibaca sp.]
KSVAQGNAEAEKLLTGLGAMPIVKASPVQLQASIGLLKRYVGIRDDLSDPLPDGSKPSFPFSYGSGDWNVMPLSEAVNGASAKYDWQPYQSRPYVYRMPGGGHFLGVSWWNQRIVTDVYALRDPGGEGIDLTAVRSYWKGEAVYHGFIHLDVNRDLAAIRTSVLGEGEIAGVRWAVRLDCENKVKCLYRSYGKQDGEFVTEGDSMQLKFKEDNLDRKFESAAVIYFYEAVDTATRQRIADALSVLLNNY